MKFASIWMILFELRPRSGGCVIWFLENGKHFTETREIQICFRPTVGLLLRVLFLVAEWGSTVDFAKKDTTMHSVLLHSERRPSIRRHQRHLSACSYLIQFEKTLLPYFGFCSQPTCWWRPRGRFFSTLQLFSLDPNPTLIVFRLRCTLETVPIDGAVSLFRPDPSLS